jgi:hypothetical protein
MAARVIFTEKQTRVLEITTVCVLIFMVLFGLFCQIENWSLPGVTLIVVATAISPLLNLIRARFSEVSARLDELEKKFATRA